MKVDASHVKTVDTANVSNEVIKLALIKSCKHLRELVGINNFMLPYVGNSDADLDGNSWLMYFIAEAAEELGE